MESRICEIITNEGVTSFYKKLIGKIKYRMFLKLMNGENWEKALIMGEELLTVFPYNVDLYRKTVDCYQNLKQYKKAYELIQVYMNFRRDFNDIVNVCEKGISTTSTFESRYCQLNGKHNMGLIEHTDICNGNHKYLTKISHDMHKENEKIFYLEIYSRFSRFYSITPKLINFAELENLYLITMEKVDSVEMELNEDTIKKIGHISKVVSSVRYGLIYKWFPFVIKKDTHKLINLLWSFGLIHEETKNKEIFNDMFRQVKEGKYSRETMNLLSRLKAIILNKMFYKYIDPMKHYSILHGDFFLRNLLYDKDRNKIYLVDWGFLRIGPFWSDMAGFLGEVRYPFHKVYSDYILDKNISGLCEPIEKVFFIYTLIMVWFIEFSREEFEKNIHLFLKPAIEQLEIYVAEVLNDIKLGRECEM